MKFQSELKDPFIDITSLVKDIVDIITDDKKEQQFLTVCGFARTAYEKPVKSLIWGWGYQFTRRRTDSVDDAYIKIEKMPPADDRAKIIMNLIGEGKWKTTSFNTGLFLNFLKVLQNNYKPLDYKTTCEALIPRLSDLLKKSLKGFIENFEAQKKAEEKREQEKAANDIHNPAHKMSDFQSRAKLLEANLGWLKSNVVLEKPKPLKNLDLSEFTMIADIFKNRPPIAPISKKEVTPSPSVKEAPLQTLEVQMPLQTEEKLLMEVKPSKDKKINNVSVVDFESLFARRRKVQPPQIEVLAEVVPTLANELTPAKKINQVNLSAFETLFANRRKIDNSNVIASPTLL